MTDSKRGTGRGYALSAGRPDPLGATFDGEGVNFAVFSAHAERIERPADLPGALTRAKEAVLNGQQALLNVICPY